MNYDFKEQLIDALHSTVADFNSSGDPNKSIAKVAAANDFNQDQTQRLVEMFNTARTLYQYKNASDRSANFKLANAADVFVQLFNDNPDKAANSDVPSYACYDVPEVSWTPQSKAAALNVPEEVIEESRSIEAMSRSALSKIAEFRSYAEELRSKGELCDTRTGQVLTKLATILSTGFVDVQTDKFARLVHGYAGDPELGPIVDKLTEFVPDHYKPDAEVTAKYARCHVVDDTDLDVELSLLKDAHVLMQHESNFTAAAAEFEKEASEFECAFFSSIGVEAAVKVAGVGSLFSSELIKAAAVTSTTKTKDGEETTNFFGEKVKTTQKSESSPQDWALMPGLAEGASETVKKPLTSMFESGVKRVVNAPRERENADLGETLKNVQRQLMLEDLLVHDPVLSGEDPEVVARAYQAILSIAPRMASNKEVVRAALRQTVHSVAWNIQKKISALN